MKNRDGASALEKGDLNSLLIRFCAPSLVSSLIISFYNIIDQFFIGNALGVLGNAATNVVFPMTAVLTALSLMCGVGASAAMSLALGGRDPGRAGRVVGNAFGLMTLCGLILSALMLSSTKPLLFLFGCTDAVWPFAEPYAKITALSFPCALWGAAGSFLMRADGSPGYALAISAAGAVLNIVLDALFIFGFGWGMQGAAWATALGQTLSALMVLAYLPKFRSMTLKPTHFRPKPLLCLRVAVMGAGPMINFLTQALVQVFLNGALRTYGAASQYGSEAALAAAGVANKVNTVATAVVTGLANGMQPIISYNYGRGNRRRVAETAAKVIWTTVLVSCAIVLLYQLVPRQITAIFGQGDEKYFEFAARFFRVFYLLLPLNGLLSSVGGLFSAQGKPGRSILLSLTRQALLLPPLLLILPRHFGLDGALWSGPSSDLGMAVLALFLFRREYRRLTSPSESGRPTKKTKA